MITTLMLLLIDVGIMTHYHCLAAAYPHSLTHTRTAGVSNLML